MFHSDDDNNAIPRMLATSTKWEGEFGIRSPGTEVMLSEVTVSRIAPTLISDPTELEHRV